MERQKRGAKVLALVLLLGVAGGIATFLLQARIYEGKKQETTAVIRGTIRSLDGRPLFGILVKARGEGKNSATSVVTDANGKYDFPPLPLGRHQVSVGTTWRKNVQLVASGATADFSVQLGADLINQTTGVSWVKAIPGTEEDKARLNSCYMHCHSAWRLFHRPPTKPDGWADIVSMMTTVGPTGRLKLPGLSYLYPAPSWGDLGKLQPYLETITPETKQRYATEAIVRPSGEAARAVFTEFDLPAEDRVATGVWVDPQGIIWYTATGINNGIGRLDPRTGDIQQWPYHIPNANLHDMFGDQEGNLWVTASAANRIVKFNTTTFQYTDWAVPDKYGKHVHTGDFDPDGNFWATLEEPVNGIGSVVKLDPRTGQFTQYPIPTKDPELYGLVIDKQGDVWFTEWLANKVGKIDRTTGKITEYTMPTPNAGPRRIQVDSKGRLWFCDYFVSKIGMLDPQTGKIVEYDIGVPGGYPYFIKVDKYDKVWFNLVNANMIGKFDPETKKFVLYLQPRPDSYGRDAAFDYSTDPYAIVYGGGLLPNIGRMYVR